MKCPNGHEIGQLVYLTRQSDTAVYRRRMCQVCGTGYKTKEALFTGMIPREAENRSRKRKSSDHLFA